MCFLWLLNSKRAKKNKTTSNSVHITDAYEKSHSRVFGPKTSYQLNSSHRESPCENSQAWLIAEISTFRAGFSVPHDIQWDDNNNHHFLHFIVDWTKLKPDFIRRLRSLQRPQTHQIKCGRDIQSDDSIKPQQKPRHGTEFNGESRWSWTVVSLSEPDERDDCHEKWAENVPSGECWWRLCFTVWVTEQKFTSSRENRLKACSIDSPNCVGKVKHVEKFSPASVIELNFHRLGFEQHNLWLVVKVSQGNIEK